MIRQRKYNPNWIRPIDDAESDDETTESSPSTPKKIVFTCSLLLFMLVCIWQTINFLQPARAITYILHSAQTRHNHYTESQAKRTDKFLKSHKSGYGLHAISQLFIYPRINTSVDIPDLPLSLQTDKFCGHNDNCDASALCHCPSNMINYGSERYPALKFRANIYDNGWQKYYNIGYPPPFNVSSIVNHSNLRVQNAWNLYNKRTSLGYCNQSAGMWERWTKPGYHKCMARAVGERLKFKPGTKVLDLGSGCGHTLAQWTYWFGIFGMGFDFQIENVLYANQIAKKNKLNYWTYHASLQSIYVDNWIPSQSFDYVFSNAALMYLGKDETCLVMEKAIDILKINGTAWFAWNDGINAMKQCIQNYVNTGNNTIGIEYTWLNGTAFLDTCSKDPSRPSLIIQRIK
eukprot:53668_1